MLADAHARTRASCAVHLIDISSQALERPSAGSPVPARLACVGTRRPTRRARAAAGADERTAAHAGAVPRLEHRQLRLAPRRAILLRDAARAAPATPAARRRSGEARGASCCSPTTIRSASPRRSTRTCSSASTASSAAEFDLGGVRRTRGLERARAAGRDAPGQPHPAGRVDRSGRPPRAVRRRRVDLDRELLQVHAKRQSTTWAPPPDLPLTATVGRRGRALRADAVDRRLTFVFERCPHPHTPRTRRQIQR